jgi:hypothetical protein
VRTVRCANAVLKEGVELCIVTYLHWCGVFSQRHLDVAWRERQDSFQHVLNAASHRVKRNLEAFGQFANRGTMADKLEKQQNLCIDIKRSRSAKETAPPKIIAKGKEGRSWHPCTGQEAAVVAIEEGRDPSIPSERENVVAGR